MKTNRTIVLVTLLAALSLLSAALIFAQDNASQAVPEATSEATTVPSSFNDGRINGNIFLGGLAIYCVDENGSSTAGNTFQGGGITVWGLNDAEYIFLSVDQLRGSKEIEQLATMEVGMTEEPMMMTATPMDSNAVMKPVLLARTTTPNGEIFFFRVGDDQFVLQGNDNTGKFFTYTWTGCALGNLQTDVAPFIPTPEPVMMATVEVTSNP